MRVTIGQKLLGLVGIAALGFAILIVAGAWIAAQVDARVKTIQSTYVPRVELEPQLDAQLDRMQRGFEDAVAARDLEALESIRDMKAKFFELLDRAGSAVEPSRAEQLREAVEAYWAAADDVSRKLIRGETGEAVTESIITMQSKQISARERIKTAGADRGELSSAFAAVTRAEATAGTTRLGISIGCLALVLVFSLIVSRRMMRSVERTTEGFDRFGTGTFDEPIRVESDDELADLARNANAMAMRLDALAKERARIEAALQGANRELEAFSYSVAHDLRAPLRGMNGFSRALLEDYGPKLDDDARDQLQRICAGAERMGHLIDALLSLSKVTRTQVSFERVDLGRTAERAIDQLRIIHPERRVQTKIADGMMVDADPALLRAILENLLGNAWKFTGQVATPSVEVGAKVVDDERAYFVKDNGAGFDMAYATKLFAPFQRLHTASEFAGTGIGLATVQRIIQRHGGRIWAESEKGKGATFWFTLPDHDR